MQAKKTTFPKKMPPQWVLRKVAEHNSDICVEVPLLILIGQLGNSLSVYQAAEQDLVV